MGTLLIKNATVITVDPELGVVDAGAVLIEDEHIAAVGPSAVIDADYPAPDRTIDRGCLDSLTAGLAPATSELG